MRIKKTGYVYIIFSFFIILLGSISDSCALSSNTSNMVPAFLPAVKALNNAKIHVSIGFLAEQDADIAPLISIIKNDLSFSGQLEGGVMRMENKPSKKDIQQFFKQGYLFALFITKGSGQSIEWRLFDTMRGTMIQGKRYIKRGDSLYGWAHNIADSVWPILTGQPPFFSTRIVYCKQVLLPEGKRIKQVCIADYNGENEQVVVDVPTINVAPRWNNDLMRPLIFYSEYTNENIRLMSVDMEKKRSIASNFDGINMLPSFSRDGKTVVYCASHGDGLCQLYCGYNGLFKKITDNKGNNISPVLTDDGASIIFCSDFKTGSPQLYCYERESESITPITRGGYCASPSYCGKRNSIAYSKKDKGVMQLYCYDRGNKMTTPLTVNEGNKEESSWSPCGNYLLFSIEKNQQSRLAVLNMLTKEIRYLTAEGTHASYPSWSPLYVTYPSVH